MQQQGVFWCFGLSGAGKTTLVKLAAKYLRQETQQVFVIDGDDLRCGICRQLGFTEADRMENVRRAAELAKLAADQGMIVLAALMTPAKSMREMAREIIGSSRYFEIYVSCSYETCSKRDAKGLYALAAQGKIHHFSGKDVIFEVPDKPALIIETENAAYNDCLNTLLAFIYKQGCGTERMNTHTSR